MKMKKDLTFKIAAISAILLAIYAIPMVRASPEKIDFNFMGPNVSMRALDLPLLENKATGMYIEPGAFLILVGAGTFDLSNGAVSGGGSYTHLAPDGTMFAKGIWSVDSFVSFDGGLLTIIIKPTRIWTKYPGFEHVKDVKMMKLKISNEGFTVWGGPGYTLPIFNVVVSGKALFHLNG